MRKIFGPNDQGNSDSLRGPVKHERSVILEGLIDGSLRGIDIFPEHRTDDIPLELMMGVLNNKRSKIAEWGVSVLPHVGFEEHSHRINDYGLDLQRRMTEDGYSVDAARLARAWMLNRFIDRCKLNYDKFSSATGKVPAILHNELEASVGGEASPVSLLLIKSFRGMDSIELGRVTVPAIRQEVVHDMNMSIDQAIDIMGGETCEPDVEFCIAESRVTSDGKFVNLITVKERMAILPDGTIIAKRSTFVVETDKEISIEDAPSLFNGTGPNRLPAVALSVICYAYSKATA